MLVSTSSLKYRVFLIACLWVVFFISLPADAASSQYFGQSILDMGDAYSGGAALADDASTNYTNPAGMVRLPHSEVQLYTDHVWSNSWISGTLTQVDPAGAEKKTHLNDVFNGGKGTIPGFHAVAKLSDRWALGLSAVLSFVAVDANTNPILKSTVSSMDATYFDVNPNLAYRLSSHWSVGGGLDAIFSRTKDHFYFMNSTDYAKIDMKGTDVGWNAGLLYSSNFYRFGLTYRSGLTSHLRGTVDTGGAVLPTVFDDKNEVGESQIPPTWRFSGLYQLSPTWVVMTTLYYTQWKQAELSGIANGDDPKKIKYYTDYDNNNTISIAVGAKHQFNQRWGMAFGVIYDPQLTDNHVLQNGENKGKRIAPNNASYGLTMGLHYQRNPQWHYAFAMLYVLPTKQNVYMSSMGMPPAMDGVTRDDVFEVALATSRVF